MELAFAAGTDSLLLSGLDQQGEQRRWYADCGDSKLHVPTPAPVAVQPPVAPVQVPMQSDLVVTGSMVVPPQVFHGGPNRGLPPQPYARIEVTNAGNQPTVATVGRARVAGVEGPAVLLGAQGQAVLGPALLQPGQKGFLQVTLPAGTVRACASYEVRIDLDRTMQAGAPDPFANDTSMASTDCLDWIMPYQAHRFGNSLSPSTELKNLKDIVSSFVIARADGQRCSACHYAGARNAYAPPGVGKDGVGSIEADEFIGGQTWRGYWANRFLRLHSYKPPELLDMVQAWKDSGFPTAY